MCQFASSYQVEFVIVYRQWGKLPWYDEIRRIKSNTDESASSDWSLGRGTVGCCTAASPEGEGGEIWPAQRVRGYRVLLATKTGRPATNQREHSWLSPLHLTDIQIPPGFSIATFFFHFLSLSSPLDYIISRSNSSIEKRPYFIKRTGEHIILPTRSILV